jgi:long-chain acyl-CoA synthetase
MIRPWTHFYPEGTSRDLPPIRWPHVPAFVRETSDKFRDHPAFTLYLPNGTQGTITYGEVDRLSDGLAVYLREMAGFGAGDRVAIQMPNCLAYPVAVFACLKAGLVMVNTNPLYTPAEMVHQFADSGSTGLIAVDLFATKVDQTLPKTKIRKVIVASLADLLPAATGLLVRVVQKYVRKMVPPISFAHVRFADAIREGAARIAAGADPSAYASALTPESPAALQYTGGTTGVAKGAVLTHGNLLANVAQSLEMWKPWLKEGREVMLTALPLYHIFAFTANLMIFYSVGGRNILIPSPRPPSNLRKVMTREPITWFTGVNTLFAALMQEPWFQEKKSWHLHGTVAGGMALVPAVGDRWEQMTRTPMYQGYGLTETSPVATLNPFHRPKRDSIGVPLPGTDVKIVDATGAEVPTGQPGELLSRGPQVMQEYWRRPDETAAVMKNGWFASGDIAVMDEDGYLAIVDRKKDLINVSGFNVYPNEVEAVLATHPGVVEMAVIGVSDEHTGEAVCAYVVRRNSSVTADMIRQHCRASLTNYKVPKHVIFREELPKSPVGKVLRKDLRELAMKGA